MKGAEALLHTLVAGGVDLCFTNPGTTEMQSVVALDRVAGMRAVLVLFEGVATGAADGFARMAGRPASTLLHLGPGLANGLANLHNAMRAGVPMVSIVGEHATYHIRHDAPLTSDIAAYAGQSSGWVATPQHAGEVAAVAAEAVAAARRPPGQIATLIVPADSAWGECDGPASVPVVAAPSRVEESAVAEAAAALRSGEPAMVILAGAALRSRGLEYAGRISARSGARIASHFLFARMERGAGRVAVERLPYAVDQAVEAMRGLKQLILVGAKAPVAFFAYPDLPGWLTPEDTQIHCLAAPDQDLEDALARLADAIGATEPAKSQPLSRPDLPTGKLTPATLGQSVAALMPENCVVVDEALTGAFPAWPATAGAPPHDWLFYTGGAIGDGLPLAVGAALACPDRRVLTLHSDGGAAYNLQALWTQAREQLNVTTVIYANRCYRILEMEYAMAAPGTRPGPRASRLLSLGQPSLDWVKIAQGMGVPAVWVDNVDDLNASLRACLREPGPNLIEAVL